MSDDIVGSGKIIIEADTDGASASISDLKDDVKSVGDEAEAAGEKVESSTEEMADGFTSAGQAIEDSTSGVRKFVGALSSVAGVVTGLVGVFGLLASAVAGVMSLLKKLNDSTAEDGIAKTRENLQGLFDTVSGESAALSSIPVFDALTKHIDELSIKVDNAKVRGLSTLVDGDFILRLETAEKKLVQLRKERESLRALAAGTTIDEELGFGDEAVERFNRYREGLKSLEQQADMLRRSIISDPLERLQAEQDAAISSTKELIRELGAENTEQAKELLDAVRERGRVEREELKKTMHERAVAEDKAIADKERREKESAERTAKAVAAAIEREITTVTNAMFGTGGSSVTTQLQTLHRTLKDIQDDMGALR